MKDVQTGGGYHQYIGGYLVLWEVTSLLWSGDAISTVRGMPSVLRIFSILNREYMFEKYDIVYRVGKPQTVWVVSLKKAVFQRES